MKRFRYLGDGLSLLCCLLYALNRWLIKPRVHSAFPRFHFDDLLLMPCALPPLLWMHWLPRLRTNDNCPTVREIALYLAAYGGFAIRHSFAPRPVCRAQVDFVGFIS